MNEMSQPRPRKIPTLQSLSASQQAAIRAIPAHDAAQKVTCGATRPTGDFTTPERFLAEKAKIFRHFPVAVAPSGQLPEPNSVLAHNGYGVPLLLTRDKGGVVRAFLNVCRHKGSLLVESCETTKMGRVSCPYHAWTFGLNGDLVGVPRQELFEGLDKSTHGLVRLPAREAGGIIWVKLDKTADDDFSHVTDELVSDLDALGFPSAYVYGKRTFPIQANWKLVLEPFLEGYHVQRLHAQSIGQLFADVPSVHSRLGLHMRQISGKAQFEPTMLDVPGENIHKTVTHAYLLFPNTVIVTSPYYISLMIVMPVSERESVVDYYMLTQSAPDNPKAEELYSKSYQIIQGVFGNEDFRAAAISQTGLESGAIDELTYCGLEIAIPEFYKSLESLL